VGDQGRRNLKGENECRKNRKDFYVRLYDKFFLADSDIKSGMSCIWLWFVKCWKSPTVIV
jgi:hypothetical protein